MKKVPTDQPQPDHEDMLPEYDFCGGVRGKHARSYRQGHSVKVHEADGTTSIQRFSLLPQRERR
jgi:hypothetical protein